MAILNQRLDTVTLFSEITNGWQYVSEDGTVYPFTFVYNNADPDNVSFDILFNGNVVQSIPLIAYDVNIATSGGFTFNPLTDILTITETDGEAHTVDLKYLKTTITSANGTVGITQTTNPDNSTNYDLSVKTAYHEVINAPYTGVELPTIVGQVAGDTDEVKFSDGTIVNYTFDGTTWVVDFVTPKSILTISNGGAGLPNTATFNNGVDAPTVFNYIEGARHDLRLTSPIVERGSDDPINPKGAQFLHDSYSHINGFSDNWIGANGGNMPVMKLENNGDVWFGAKDETETNNRMVMHFNYQNQSIIAGRHLQASYTDIGARCSILGGYFSYINGGDSNGIYSAYQSTINGTDYGISCGGRLNIMNGATFGGVFGGYNNNVVGVESFIIASQISNVNNDRAVVMASYDGTANGYGSKIIGASDATVNGAYASAIGGGYGILNSFYETKIGIKNITWAASSNSYIMSDPLFTVANGDGIESNNSLTMLKSGSTQIHVKSDFINSRTQSQATPNAAFEVVSIESGFLAPRMTEVQINNFMATLNLTTDVTGGINGNEYSKKGMQIECTDCVPNDGSTQGCTVKLYPNASVTGWIAKKMW